MPHIIVKLWPGKSEDQKQRLADAITADVTGILDYGPDSVAVEGARCPEEILRRPGL